MRFVEPEVYLIAETRVDWDGLSLFMEAINSGEWKTNAHADGEALVEVMGRLCYNSFVVGNNPNVTKIREGNPEYIANIINQAHGSVLEHVNVTFVFHNISRVFTHELVRHRVGVAISQESLRYVRLSDLKVWVPNMVASHKAVGKVMEGAWRFSEAAYASAATVLNLDSEKSFHIKKKWTSALRRLAPIGLATTIGWTANLRTLRHVLERRTDPSAEEEIRLVFGKVGRILKERYPAVFADYEVEEVDGAPHFKTKNPKV